MTKKILRDVLTFYGTICLPHLFPSYVYNRGQIPRKSMIIVTDRNVSVMGHCGVRLEIEVN